MKYKWAILLMLIVVTGPGLAFSQADDSLKRVLGRGVLRAGLDASELPWSTLDYNTGQYSGMDVDILNWLAQKLGVQLQIVDTDWDFLLSNLIQNKYDIVINGMTIDPTAYKTEDFDKVSFSIPYYHYGAAILVRKDNQDIHGLEDLKGKVVATLAYCSSENFVRSILGIKEIKTSSDNDAELQAKYFRYLANGDADAVVYDYPGVAWMASQHSDLFKIPYKIEGQNAYGQFTQEAYGAVVSKKNRALLDQINILIAELMRSKEYQEILKKWSSSPQ
jgi:ABC-type amino acid transport substrate-binding protein